MTTEGGALGGRMRREDSRTGGLEGWRTRGLEDARTGGREGAVERGRSTLPEDSYVVTRSRPYRETADASLPEAARTARGAVPTSRRRMRIERGARGGRMSGVPLTYASPYPGLFIGLFHGR